MKLCPVPALAPNYIGWFQANHLSSRGPGKICRVLILSHTYQGHCIITKDAFLIFSMCSVLALHIYSFIQHSNLMKLVLYSPLCKCGNWSLGHHASEVQSGDMGTSDSKAGFLVVCFVAPFSLNARSESQNVWDSQTNKGFTIGELEWSSGLKGLKSGLRTSSISITRVHLRNANYLTESKSLGVGPAVCALTRPLGDSTSVEFKGADFLAWIMTLSCLSNVN